MQLVSVFIGALFGFVGTWGAVIAGHIFLDKANRLNPEGVASWHWPALVALSIIAAGLGAMAGVAVIKHIERL